MQKTNVLKLFAISAVLGCLIGLVSDLFIRLIQFGSRLIWSDLAPSAHRHAWAIILISVIGGLVMGLCVKFFGTNDEGIGFDAVLAAVQKDGELGFKQIKRVVLNTYPGLITGASIGPEAPLITLSGFCGDFLAKLLRTSKKQLAAFIAIALGGSMGVLLDTPVAGPILFAESPPTTDKNTNKLLIFTSMVAASVGFAIYYYLGAPLLKNEKLVPAYSGFQAMHLVYGLIIGIIGTAVGVGFKYLILYVRKLAQKFSRWPVSRGAAAGLIIGICGAVYPLVMFDGSAQLSSLVKNAATYSVITILVMALVRVLSTSVALGSGYQGGNIFPLIFIAGAVGLAISGMFHFIPAPVAMVACMASIMYVFTPMPLFCIFLFTEISSSSLIPVMAMSLVSAYFLSSFTKLRYA